MKNAASPPEYTETQWFIFTDRGKGSVIEGESATKAISNWKSTAGKKGGKVVGVIRAAMTAEIDRVSIRGTEVFGVICCVQKSK